jgi:hypothetical protein
MILICIVSYNANAQSVEKNYDSTKFCIIQKDGKVQVMMGMKDVTSDIMLANGTLIKTNGTLIKKNGYQIHLKEGQCIDIEGHLLTPLKAPIREKTQKEEPQVYMTIK